LHQLTDDGEDEFPVFWSRDNTWICYRSVSEQQGEWRRMTTDGSRSESLSLPEAPIIRLGPANDIIYLDSSDGSILGWNLESNQTRPLIDRAFHSDWQQFDTTSEGIYFTDGTDNERILRYHDFATGQTGWVCDLPTGVGNAIHVSTDGSVLFIEMHEVRSDLQIANIASAGAESWPSPSR